MEAQEYAKHDWATSTFIRDLTDGHVEVYQYAKTPTGEQAENVDEVYCTIPTITTAQIVGYAVRYPKFADLLRRANFGKNIDATVNQVSVNIDADRPVPHAKLTIAQLIDVELTRDRLDMFIEELEAARDELPPPLVVPEDTVIRIESEVTYTQPINNVHELLEHDEQFQDGKWFGDLIELHSALLAAIDENISDYAIEWAGVRGNISIEAEDHLDTFLDDDDWAT